MGMVLTREPFSQFFLLGRLTCGHTTTLHLKKMESYSFLSIIQRRNCKSQGDKVYHEQTVTSALTDAPSKGPRRHVLHQGIDKCISEHDTCPPEQLCAHSLCGSAISIGDLNTAMSSLFSSEMGAHNSGSQETFTVRGSRKTHAFRIPCSKEIHSSSQFFMIVLEIK